MRAIVSEGIGTGLLVAAVVGSGIMGERLAGGNMALALLANSVATGTMLVTLIFTFGPISGAHFNPAVSIAAAVEGGFAWRRVPGYIVAQIVGAIGGVMSAHVMFELPFVMLSQHSRVGFAQLFSEFLATFGLLVVVHGTGRRAAARSPLPRTSPRPTGSRRARASRIRP
jgi:glycerol uptake facilitator-like aquaporin